MNSPLEFGIYLFYIGSITNLVGSIRHYKTKIPPGPIHGIIVSSLYVGGCASFMYDTKKRII
jgi:hypothetical protein